MIIGTGIDIIEVLRIKKALDMWGEKFLNRVFTKRELSYANKKKFSHENLAARFACKEAVLKAQGDGLLKALDSVDVAAVEGRGPWTAKVGGDPSSQEYSFMDIEGPAGFAAAVAMDGRRSNISVLINYF